jgi:hypothetical protein
MRFLNHHEREFKQLLNSCECECSDGPSLDRYFASLDLPKEKVETLVSELSMCTCCTRHSWYRPPCLIPGDDLPKSPGNPTQAGDDVKDCSCKCRCRHYSRMLCRAYGDLSDIAEADFEDAEDDVSLTKQPIPPLPLPPLAKMAVATLLN